MNKRTSQPLAAYLTELVEATGLSHQQIADEAGFFSVQYLDHVLAGRAKFSISRVASFAIAVGCDPKHLLRVVLGEYAPDVLDAIQRVYGILMLSENEGQLIARRRELSGLRDLPCSVIKVDEEILPLTFLSFDDEKD